MNFTQLTPLELMSLADRERVHTALLGWVLGADSPLTVATRYRVAAALAGQPASGNAQRTEARTEVEEKIDLVLELGLDTGRQFLAVEAKLRSAEHSGQLARYDAAIAAAGLDPCWKVFLTLDGMRPRSSPAWRPVSYEELWNVLRSEYAASGVRDVYLDDHLLLVERLVSVIANLTDEEVAQVVFGKRAVDPAMHPGLVRWVQRLKLGKTLQQCWMNRLLARALELMGRPLQEPWWAELDETHGEALLNVQNTERHRGYAVGVQVQYGTFKMFCSPYPPAKAAAQEIQRARDILQAMAVAVGVMGRHTDGRKRGFTSFRVGTPPANRRIAEWAPLLATCLRQVISAAGH